MGFRVVPVGVVVDKGTREGRCELGIWDQFRYLVVSAGPNNQVVVIQLEIDLK